MKGNITMLRSKISIMGLYEYDDSIFDNFNVPDEMDRDVTIAEILMQCAELELIYPSAPIMKTAIENWTKAELPQWQRAYRDMTIEYNPIWNVDGTETETIERELSGRDVNTLNTDKNNTRTIESEVETNNETETQNTTVNSVAGYNGEGFANSEKTENDGSQTGSGNQTTEGTEKGTETGSEKGQSDKTEAEKITTTKTRGGNIGVTMTQQMLNADLDLLIRLNPYQFIVDSFKKRFCLLVY